MRALSLHTNPSGPKVCDVNGTGKRRSGAKFFDVNAARKRVGWLEQRIKKLLTTDSQIVRFCNVDFLDKSFMQNSCFTSWTKSIYTLMSVFGIFKCSFTLEFPIFLSRTTYFLLYVRICNFSRDWTKYTRTKYTWTKYTGQYVLDKIYRTKYTGEQIYRTNIPDKIY